MLQDGRVQVWNRQAPRHSTLLPGGPRRNLQGLRVSPESRAVWQADPDDWVFIPAGVRAQIIKKDPKTGKGMLQFGTEARLLAAHLCSGAGAFDIVCNNAHLCSWLLIS